MNELQAITFDEESASDGQKFIALPKRHFFEKKSFLKNKSPKNSFGRRKMKCRESSETRFPKVSRQSEPCSRGERPIEVSKKHRNLWVDVRKGDFV